MNKNKWTIDETVAPWELIGHAPSDSLKENQVDASFSATPPSRAMMFMDFPCSALEKRNVLEMSLEVFHDIPTIIQSESH